MMSELNREIFPNHNVYILGAGFSVDAGLPVIANFLNRMRDSVDWLVERDWERERKAVQQVFQFRLQAAGAAYRIGIDVENIEDLFSLASASEGDQTGSIKSEQLSSAIAATLEFAQSNTHQKHKTEVFINKSPVNEFPESWQVNRVNVGGKDMMQSVDAPTYHIYGGILSGRYCDSHNQQNTVLTFNYDTLLEDALFEQKIPFTYGFSADDESIEFDS
jgi:hypothetical protein